jgi:hypothetical protein
LERARAGRGRKQEQGRVGPRENEGKNLREVRQTSRSWAESLTGPKKEVEKEKKKNFFLFLELTFGKRII